MVIFFIFLHGLCIIAAWPLWSKSPTEEINWFFGYY